MKKIILVLGVSLLSLVFGCTTNVGVESAAHPAGEYDAMSGEMTGKLDGNMMSVFKVANIALDQLKYYRVGEKVSEKTSKAITAARGPRDVEIIIEIYQIKPNVCKVVINYGDGELMKSQEIYNLMAKIQRDRGL